MARKSQHTFSKRQREQKKAEKAAHKRARRAAGPDSPVPLPETSGDEATSEEDTETVSE